FVGRPVILTGRFDGELPREIRVTGKLRGETQTLKVAVQREDAPLGGKALASVWARQKIADLADRATFEPTPDLGGQIRQIAMEYNLMSAFTAFVAVDSMTRTAADHGTT